ncbi:MAG: hypothetical protein IJ837_02790 [Clostridia bacterium]|nr:hypothetical protein [Clostridia bacterium]
MMNAKIKFWHILTFFVMLVCFLCLGLTGCGNPRKGLTISFEGANGTVIEKDADGRDKISLVLEYDENGELTQKAKANLNIKVENGDKSLIRTVSVNSSDESKFGVSLSYDQESKTNFCEITAKGATSGEYGSFLEVVSNEDSTVRKLLYVSVVEKATTMDFANIINYNVDKNNFVYEITNLGIFNNIDFTLDSSKLFTFGPKTATTPTIGFVLKSGNKTLAKVDDLTTIKIGKQDSNYFLFYGNQVERITLVDNNYFVFETYNVDDENNTDFQKNIKIKFYEDLNYDSLDLQKIDDASEVSNVEIYEVFEYEQIESIPISEEKYYNYYVKVLDEDQNEKYELVTSVNSGTLGIIVGVTPAYEIASQHLEATFIKNHNQKENNIGIKVTPDDDEDNKLEYSYEILEPDDAYTLFEGSLTSKDEYYNKFYLKTQVDSKNVYTLITKENFNLLGIIVGATPVYKLNNTIYILDGGKSNAFLVGGLNESLNGTEVVFKARYKGFLDIPEITKVPAFEKSVLFKIYNYPTMILLNEKASTNEFEKVTGTISGSEIYNGYYFFDESTNNYVLITKDNCNKTSISIGGTEYNLSDISIYKLVQAVDELNVFDVKSGIRKGELKVDVLGGSVGFDNFTISSYKEYGMVNSFIAGALRIVAGKTYYTYGNKIYSDSNHGLEVATIASNNSFVLNGKTYYIQNKVVYDDSSKRNQVASIGDFGEFMLYTTPYKLFENEEKLTHTLDNNQVLTFSSSAEPGDILQGTFEIMLKAENSVSGEEVFRRILLRFDSGITEIGAMAGEKEIEENSTQILSIKQNYGIVQKTTQKINVTVGAEESATYEDRKGNKKTYLSVSSSRPSVATVYYEDENKKIFENQINPEDLSFIVEAKSEGTTTITIKTESGTATCSFDVVVKSVPEVITINPNAASIPVRTFYELENIDITKENVKDFYILNSEGGYVHATGEYNPNYIYYAFMGGSYYEVSNRKTLSEIKIEEGNTLRLDYNIYPTTASVSNVYVYYLTKDAFENLGSNSEIKTALLKLINNEGLNEDEEGYFAKEGNIKVENKVENIDKNYAQLTTYSLSENNEAYPCIVFKYLNESNESEYYFSAFKVLLYRAISSFTTKTQDITLLYSGNGAYDNYSTASLEVEINPGNTTVSIESVEWFFVDENGIPENTGITSSTTTLSKSGEIQIEGTNKKRDENKLLGESVGVKALGLPASSNSQTYYVKATITDVNGSVYSIIFSIQIKAPVSITNLTAFNYDDENGIYFKASNGLTEYSDKTKLARKNSSENNIPEKSQISYLDILLETSDGSTPTNPNLAYILFDATVNEGGVWRPTQRVKNSYASSSAWLGYDKALEKYFITPIGAGYSLLYVIPQEQLSTAVENITTADTILSICSNINNKDVVKIFKIAVADGYQTYLRLFNADDVLELENEDALDKNYYLMNDIDMTAKSISLIGTPEKPFSGTIQTVTTYDNGFEFKIGTKTYYIYENKVYSDEARENEVTLTETKTVDGVTYYKVGSVDSTDYYLKTFDYGKLYTYSSGKMIEESEDSVSAITDHVFANSAKHTVHTIYGIGIDKTLELNNESNNSYGFFSAFAGSISYVNFRFSYVRYNYSYNFETTETILESGSEKIPEIYLGVLAGKTLTKINQTYSTKSEYYGKYFNGTLITEENFESLGITVNETLIATTYNPSILNSSVFVEEFLITQNSESTQNAKVFAGTFGLNEISNIENFNITLTGTLKQTKNKEFFFGAFSGCNNAELTKEISVFVNVSSQIDNSENLSVGFGGAIGINKQNIENITVSGSIVGGEKVAYLGGIVGLSSAQILNCRSSIVLANATYVGGIVGLIDNSNIDNCVYENYATNNSVLSSNVQNSFVGGIAGGVNKGNITNSYVMIFNNSVKNQIYSTNVAGGVVGAASNNCEISKSFFSGNIYANKASGLVGNLSNTLTIENAYVVGELRTEDDAYLLVDNSATVKTSYSALVGYLVQNGEETLTKFYLTNGGTLTTLTDVYYLSGTSTQTDATPLSSSEMQQKDNFGDDFGFGNVWEIIASKNYGYPYLIGLYPEIPTGFNVELKKTTGVYEVLSEQSNIKKVIINLSEFKDETQNIKISDLFEITENPSSLSNQEASNEEVLKSIQINVLNQNTRVLNVFNLNLYDLTISIKEIGLGVLTVSSKLNPEANFVLQIYVINGFNDYTLTKNGTEINNTSISLEKDEVYNFVATYLKTIATSTQTSEGGTTSSGEETTIQVDATKVSGGIVFRLEEGKVTFGEDEFSKVINTGTQKTRQEIITEILNKSSLEAKQNVLKTNYPNSSITQDGSNYKLFVNGRNYADIENGNVYVYMYVENYSNIVVRPTELASNLSVDVFAYFVGSFKNGNATEQEIYLLDSSKKTFTVSINSGIKELKVNGSSSFEYISSIKASGKAEIDIEIVSDSPSDIDKGAQLTLFKVNTAVIRAANTTVYDQYGHNGAVYQNINDYFGKYYFYDNNLTEITLKNAVIYENLIILNLGTEEEVDLNNLNPNYIRDFTTTQSSSNMKKQTFSFSFVQSYYKQLTEPQVFKLVVTNYDNKKIEREVYFRFVPESISDIELHHYADAEFSENNQTMVSSYLINAGSVPSDTILAGQYGLLELKLLPEYANFDKIEITSVGDKTNDRISFKQLARSITQGEGNSLQTKYYVYDSNITQALSNTLELEKVSNYFDGAEPYYNYDGTIWLQTLVSKQNVINTKFFITITVYYNGVPESFEKEIQVDSSLVLGWSFDGLTKEADSLMPTAYIVSGLTYKSKLTLNKQGEFSSISDVNITKISGSESGNLIVNSVDTTYTYTVDATNAQIGDVFEVQVEGRKSMIALNSNSVYVRKIVRTIRFVVVDFILKDDALQVKIDENDESKGYSHEMVYAYEKPYKFDIVANESNIEVATNGEESLNAFIKSLNTDKYQMFSIRLQNSDGSYTTKMLNEVAKNNLLLYSFIKMGNGEEDKLGNSAKPVYDGANCYIKYVSGSGYYVCPINQASDTKIYLNRLCYDYDLSGHLVLTKEPNIAYNSAENSEWSEDANKMYSYKSPENENIFGVVPDIEITINFVQKTSIDNPIPIHTENEFLAMREGADYILMNDLQFGGIINDEQKPLYEPINTAIASLDGNGKTITIKEFVSFENQTTYNLGLFGTVSNTTILKNLTVCYESMNLSLESLETLNFGGICAINNGIITNCEVRNITNAENNASLSFEGNTDATTVFMFGGLCAQNNKNITNSRVKNLNLTASGIVAGFAAQNSGVISACYTNFGIVKNTSTQNIANIAVTAGFVAQNSGRVLASYVGVGYLEETEEHGKVVSQTQQISSNVDVGGFAYINSGEISDSFCAISLSIENRSLNAYSGGFVFTNEKDAKINRCYTISKIQTYSRSHTPFIGPSKTSNALNYVNALDINDCYYYDSGFGTETITLTNELGVNSLSIKQFANTNNREISCFEAYSVSKYSDISQEISSVWTFVDAQNAYFRTETLFDNKLNKQILGPQLVYANLKINPNREFDKYENNNYVYTEKCDYNYENILRKEERDVRIIDSAEKFVAYLEKDIEHNDVIKESYRLVDDIDLSTVDMSTYNTKTFVGSLDGNGFTIKNINILSTDVSSVGLFGIIGDGEAKTFASIHDVNLQVGLINATNAKYVGALAGNIQNSVLSNISVSETNSNNIQIFGKNMVGGLAGKIEGLSRVSGITSSVSVSAGFSENYTENLIYNSDLLSLYQVEGGSTYIFENIPNKSINDESKLCYAGGIFGVADLTPSDSVIVNKNSFNESRIKNLKVVGASKIIGATSGGVFGLLGARTYATDIEKITDQNSYIKSARFSGGIVGENHGTLNYARLVYQKAIQDAIDGSSYVGATNTNENYNLFRNDSSTTEFSKGVGGLVGFNFGLTIGKENITTGVITNSYNKVKVYDEKADIIGGLVGISVGGNFDSNYVTSSVGGSKQSYTGGAIGYVAALNDEKMVDIIISPFDKIPYDAFEFLGQIFVVNVVDDNPVLAIKNSSSTIQLDKKSAKEEELVYDAVYNGVTYTLTVPIKNKQIDNSAIGVTESYDNSKTYEVGKKVKYGNMVYECIVAITTPEAWNTSHWRNINVICQKIGETPYPILVDKRRYDGMDEQTLVINNTIARNNWAYSDYNRLLSIKENGKLGGFIGVVGANASIQSAHKYNTKDYSPTEVSEEYNFYVSRIFPNQPQINSNPNSGQILDCIGYDPRNQESFDINWNVTFSQTEQFTINNKNYYLKSESESKKLYLYYIDIDNYSTYISELTYNFGHENAFIIDGQLYYYYEEQDNSIYKIYAEPAFLATGLTRYEMFANSYNKTHVSDRISRHWSAYNYGQLQSDGSYKITVFDSALMPIYNKTTTIIKLPIFTVEEFKSIKNMPSLDYILMNDLDFGGEGISLCGANEPFTGTFDGNGHTLCNISPTNGTLTGIFGVTDGAEIYNLKISGVVAQINSLDSDFGVLASRATNTVFENIEILNGYNYQVTQVNYVGKMFEHNGNSYYIEGNTIRELENNNSVVGTIADGQVNIDEETYAINTMSSYATFTLNGTTYWFKNVNLFYKSGSDYIISVGDSKVCYKDEDTTKEIDIESGENDIFFKIKYATYLLERKTIKITNNKFDIGDETYTIDRDNQKIYMQNGSFVEIKDNFFTISDTTYHYEVNNIAIIMVTKKSEQNLISLNLWGEYNHNIGGLVGEYFVGVNGKLENVSVDCDFEITTSKESGGINIGGVVGKVVGEGYTTTVSNSQFKGNLTTSCYGNIGGFVGQTSMAHYSNNVVLGEVTLNAISAVAPNVGGFVGYASPIQKQIGGGEISITQNLFEGITVLNSINVNILSQGSKFYVGGFAGEFNGSAYNMVIAPDVYVNSGSYEITTYDNYDTSSGSANALTSQQITGFVANTVNSKSYVANGDRFVGIQNIEILATFYNNSMFENINPVIRESATISSDVGPAYTNIYYDQNLSLLSVCDDRFAKTTSDFLDKNIFGELTIVNNPTSSGESSESTEQSAQSESTQSINKIAITSSLTKLGVYNVTNDVYQNRSSLINSGSKLNPRQISNLNDLNSLPSSTFNYYVQTANIEGVNIQDSRKLNGFYNGNNFSVKFSDVQNSVFGTEVQNDATQNSNSKKQIALFECVNKSVVSSLSVCGDVRINIKTSTSGSRVLIGLVVGSLEKGSVIYGTYATGKLTVEDDDLAQVVGGLCGGMFDGQIIDSGCNVNLFVNGSGDVTRVGGLVGTIGHTSEINKTYSDCRVDVVSNSGLEPDVRYVVGEPLFDGENTITISSLSITQNGNTINLSAGTVFSCSEQLNNGTNTNVSITVYKNNNNLFYSIKDSFYNGMIKISNNSENTFVGGLVGGAIKADNFHSTTAIYGECYAKDSYSVANFVNSNFDAIISSVGKMNVKNVYYSNKTNTISNTATPFSVVDSIGGSVLKKDSSNSLTWNTNAWVSSPNTPIQNNLLPIPYAIKNLGILSDSVLIKSEEELNYYLNHSQEGATYTLNSDMDFSKMSTVTKFVGTLDGNGYKIYNINSTFITTNNGTIKNVEFVNNNGINVIYSNIGTVQNVYVHYGENVSVLNSGTITDCMIGDANATNSTGGLISRTINYDDILSSDLDFVSTWTVLYDDSDSTQGKLWLQTFAKSTNTISTFDEPNKNIAETITYTIDRENNIIKQGETQVATISEDKFEIDGVTFTISSSETTKTITTYSISTKEQYAEVLRYLNALETLPNEVVIKLAGDIDFEGMIINKLNKDITLNGNNGKTMKNFGVVNDALFNDSSNIFDVTFSNVNFYGNKGTSNYSLLVDENKGTISNVTIENIVFSVKSQATNVGLIASTLNKDLSNITIENVVINTNEAENLGAIVPVANSGKTLTDITISGLKINTKANYVGGVVGTNSGTISNINLETITITGTKTIGGVAGTNSGEISNITLKDYNITSTASSDSYYVGGVVGKNEGTISNITISKNNENNTISAANAVVGGVAGTNSGTITKTESGNFNVSNVQITSSGRAGGLVGTNSGTISNINLETITIIGDKAIGGAIGVNTGTIFGITLTKYTITSNSQSDSFHVGGFVGNNSGTLENFVLSGQNTITADRAKVGGIVGRNSGTITIPEDGLTISNITISGNGTIGGFVGHNSSQISGKIKVEYTNLSSTGGAAEIGSVYGRTNQNVDYFEMKYVKITDEFGATVGKVVGVITNGSSTISGRFMGYNRYPVTGTFGGLVGKVLENATLNVDMMRRDFALETSKKAQNVGGIVGELFGTLNITTMKNVSVTDDFGSTNVGGFVGKVASGGIINYTSNEAARQITVSGNSENIGGYVGVNDGTINFVFDGNYDTTTLSPKGETAQNAGGIVGYNKGIINAEINGNNQFGVTSTNTNANSTTGGIAGLNEGQIEKAIISNISVSGTNYVGGVAGLNEGQIEKAIISNISVGGINYVGGIAGKNAGTIGKDDTTNYVQLQGGIEVSGNTYLGAITGLNDTGASIIGSTKSIITDANGTYLVTYNSASNSEDSGVGMFVAVNNGTMRNIILSFNSSQSFAVSNASTNVGLIVGLNSGTIENNDLGLTAFSNAQTVTISATDPATIQLTNVGLIGKNTGTIKVKNITAYGLQITGYTNVGVVGNNSGTLNITNALISGSEEKPIKITATDTTNGYAGAIGYNSGAVVSYLVVNNLEITAQTAGAIAGYNSSSKFNGSGKFNLFGTNYYIMGNGIYGSITDTTKVASIDNGNNFKMTYHLSGNDVLDAKGNTVASLETKTLYVENGNIYFDETKTKPATKNSSSITLHVNDNKVYRDSDYNNQISTTSQTINLHYYNNAIYKDIDHAQKLCDVESSGTEASGVTYYPFTLFGVTYYYSTYGITTNQSNSPISQIQVDVFAMFGDDYYLANNTLFNSDYVELIGNRIPVDSINLFGNVYYAKNNKIYDSSYNEIDSNISLDKFTLHDVNYYVANGTIYNELSNSIGLASGFSITYQILYVDGKASKVTTDNQEINVDLVMEVSISNVKLNNESSVVKFGVNEATGLSWI